MRKKETFDRERIGRIMECLVGDYEQLFNMDEILAGHKEYSESMEHGGRILGQLAGMDGLYDMIRELVDDVHRVRDYAAEAGYMQGLKDGLSLIRFAVSPKETITIFGEPIKFQTAGGGNADVQ